MKRKKNFKYKKAAEAIYLAGHQPGCCYALHVAHNYREDEVMDKVYERFEKVFKPTDEENIRLNGEHYGAFWFGKRDDQQNQLARSLALLLVYEMKEK